MLYWADQIPSRNIEKDISTDTYSRGANATLKSDLRACSNAFENRVETLIEDVSIVATLARLEHRLDFVCGLFGLRHS